MCCMRLKFSESQTCQIFRWIREAVYHLSRMPPGDTVLDDPLPCLYSCNSAVYCGTAVIIDRGTFTGTVHNSIR